METHYYKATDIASFSNLFGINKFWCDLADYLSTKPQDRSSAFYSSNFTDCHKTDREIVMCLTFMDLIFDSGNVNHQFNPNESIGV